MRVSVLISLLCLVMTSFGYAKQIPIYLAYEYALGSKVVAISDNNEDGDFDDAGERYLYFGKGNLSNVGNFTGAKGETAFQDIVVTRDNTVYLPDISNKVVYVGKDKNNDGDIQDKGEVNVWVSENNAAGYSLQNIMAVEPGADGAIYLLKAGDQADVEDRIYRTVDKNNDGDANDAGEMSIYVADSEFPKLTFGNFTLPNAFAGLDLVNYQGDLYVLDTGIGSGEARIYRLRDSNSDGQIKANEISLFFQASDIYTRDTEQVMQRLTADDKGIYLLHEPFYYYDRQIGAYKDFEPKDRRIETLAIKSFLSEAKLR